MTSLRDVHMVYPIDSYKVASQDRNAVQGHSLSLQCNFWRCEPEGQKSLNTHNRAKREAEVLTDNHAGGLE